VKVGDTLGARMQISRRVVRFNQAINNPVQLRYAWLLPPWAVIVHRGRRSGRIYRTPVNGYRRGSKLAVVVLYGERSDWVQNVLGGGAQVVRGGRTYDVLEPRLVDPRDPDAANGELPAAARRLGRVSGKVLLARLGGPVGRFGRGPRAG
jgi:deazaflavin-dependent oxidoreductase (nitroreductase family)